MKNLVAFVVLFTVSQSVMAGETIEYDTTLSLEPESAEFSVVTTLTFPDEALVDGKAQLFLSQGVTIEALAGDALLKHSLAASTKVPIWNALSLHFREEAKAPYVIQLSYSGALSADARSQGNFIDATQVHLSIDSAWHPIMANFATPLIGKLEVNLADDWQLFGPGQLTVEDSRFELVREQALLDVAFYAAKMPKSIDKNGFSVIYDASNATKATVIANAGQQCLAQMNQRFGGATPLTNVHAVVVERDGPSYARGNFISLNADALSSNHAIYHYLCHELAHNWTAMTNAMSHDYWMTESFAEYLAAEALQEAYGSEAFEHVVQQWQARAQGQPFVWRAELNQRASHKVNYGLGPLALMQLKQRIGEETFAALSDWYMSSGITETEALLAQLEQFTDQPTRAWFKRLLAGDSPS